MRIGTWHAPERLAPALEPARRAELSTRIELSPLTRSEAAELLGPTDDSTVADLYADSGGNPFYLEQLARALDRAASRVGAAATPTFADLRVPPLVVAALAEELALLARGRARGAERCGRRGRSLRPGARGGRRGRGPRRRARSGGRTAPLGAVRETDVPRRFRFRHPLVRRAVYESAPGGWRLGAHERCADALAARGSVAAERAHHVERAGRQGDPVAVATLREAATSAAYTHLPARRTGSPSRFVCCPATPPADERVELLLARAGALASCGHFVEAHEALLDTMKLVPSESVSLRVRLTTACAAVEHLLGRHEDAHRRLVLELEGLDDADSAEAAALMIELALDGVHRMAFEQIGVWANRAVGVARRLGDDALTASAVAARAWGSGLCGHVSEAQEYTSEAAALVDSLSDDEVAARLDAAINLAARSSTSTASRKQASTPSAWWPSRGRADSRRSPSSPSCCSRGREC